TTYTITGLLEGTRYYFKIKVIDNAGNEAFSEQVGSTTLEKRERKEFPRLLIGVVVIIIAIVAIAFVIITRKLKND
ncbi:MAG: fibronectin type III domain-containing protein, partial [Candidatus Thermoplasmatota archaeon]